MKYLPISKDLKLPISTVTQKLAFLGTTGSGKTYGASKLAEEFWSVGAQFVVLDPVGVMIPETLPIFEVFANETIQIPTSKIPEKPLNIRMKNKPEPLVNYNIQEGKPLSKASKEILSYLHSVYPESKTKTQLWVATGYAPGGGFDNQIYALGNLIEKVNGKYKASYGQIDSSLINDSFNSSYEKWFNKLGTCSVKIFKLLLENPSEPLSKEQLAQTLGYALGGGFDNQIYKLTGPELIKKTLDGYIINPEILDL